MNLEILLEEKTHPEEEHDDEWYSPPSNTFEVDYRESDYLKMFESLKEQ